MSHAIRRTSQRRALAEINVVPYIDVMLVLLIIFMVSAPLLSPSLINLPSAGKTADPPQQVIEIEVTQASQYRLRVRGKDAGQERQSALATLAQDIRAFNLPEQTPVVIAADRELKYQQVIAVMDTLRSNGIQHVGLLTSPNP